MVGLFLFLIWSKFMKAFKEVCKILLIAILTLLIVSGIVFWILTLGIIPTTPVK
jgi:cell division septal protein FtsQ